ncbi:MAG TPA: fumarylacetoacetase [Micromonosporaceae bacterium]|nr:fumarylacetoacetase [Micromonosporaceae bacterium]
MSSDRSWVPGADGTAYGVRSLPYGVFVRAGERPAIGVRIGDHVLDLGRAERDGHLDAGGTLGAESLNPFMALGRPAWDRVRASLVGMLTDDSRAGELSPLLVPLRECELRLPFEVADYVDFYSSEQHASNVGQMFRPGAPPLTPNWKHLPIAYHGRAGTVVVSGTDVMRPCGQRRMPDADSPVFGPSVRLDVEAEVGFVVGVPTALGDRVPVDAFADHVFGVVLVNDWSARDIQAWEYVPLGPFLGKSFATSVSAWVLPLAALDAARVPAPPQVPPVLDYLTGTSHDGYDLSLEVEWNGTVVSRPPFRTLYWTPAQQLAHMTVNGASLRTGDLYASGTVSGPGRDETGSFLELTWNGADPVTLADGTTRTFLEDGDTVTMRATAPGPDGSVVKLGDVTGTVRTHR